MPTVEYRGMNLVVPENDSEWREYFTLARGHRLMLRACRQCQLMRYPPSHGCPWCGTRGWTWREVSGRGNRYSSGFAGHRIRRALRAWTPCRRGLLELSTRRGSPREREVLGRSAKSVTTD